MSGRVSVVEWREMLLKPLPARPNRNLAAEIQIQERQTLDVIAEHLTVTLGSSLSKTLSSFTAARHFVVEFN